MKKKILSSKFQDSVSVLVNGVVDFRVFGAVASIQNVENSAVEGSYNVKQVRLGYIKYILNKLN